ncbi:MBL fold metallo-hydrolase [Pseudonocardia sp.]|uniref:MBL fold metallo-hydrolase n=1 Tax=Pseudonocardia sp. TaxID=60912 RepID=UPI003D12BD74
MDIEVTGALVFRQYYLGCLSQASYLLGDRTTGRAVVVDPQRDIGEYLADADAAGLRIERVIETHVHADFLSGHLELAEATGAIVSFGAAAQVGFAVEPLADGQVLSLGEVEIEVRHTPGHTPESVCLVVRERAGAPPWGVLTGDTLFIGDVGRPDLLGASGWSPDELARALYHSTRERLLDLPDATRVFPAHGAGSACGKNLSSETSSTIGEQRRTNYALAPMPEEAFVAAVLDGQSTAPPYFAHASQANRAAHPILHEDEPVPALAFDDVPAGAVVLDTRDPADFAAGHLARSVNVGLGGRFAEMTGDVVGADDDIVLLADAGTEREARNRLARIGFDRVLGHLDGGVSAVPTRHLRAASRLTAARLADLLDGGRDVQVVDVRGPGEVRVSGTVPGARPVPLPELTRRLGELDPRAPTVVLCAGGYRSSIAASVLRARGFADVSDLVGGFGAWQDGRRPVAPPAASGPTG